VRSRCGAKINTSSPLSFPARLGYEAVGTVDSVGKDVTTIAVGDEVYTIPSFSMNQYGMYGEVVLAPIHAVVKHPKGLSAVEAASIWVMFVTAYGALIEDAKIISQDAVVIPRASSSVGLAAIQMANCVGAKVDRINSVPVRSESSSPMRVRSMLSRPRKRI
jgi:NADPH:quinone reductase-like Zn-dependent oxidoreductase